MRTNTVKEALRRGEPQVGTWLTLASPFAARFLAGSGFRWLTVDLEHSPADWETAALMFSAISDAGCVPLARVPVNSYRDIKRALDSGAYGIVVPMVNSPEEAAAAVAAARYFPEGNRSVGGGFHALNFGATASEYFAAANREVLVVIQAEHVKAVENADRIFAVPGIDAMFVGPNDLLSSMGKVPQMETDDPEFVNALRHLRETARRHGIAPGLHTADAEAARRRTAEGWQLVAVASDVSFMLSAAQSSALSLGLGEGRTQVRY
jgi:4-hydroxy-2-oxoheptanedioate aldolase